ncbi:carboxypeptidase-like regulatory domain-containing protein [uncultured Flavobacterium sp.]|jgi:iron complex outermembrane receptor protein|uniref:TonB-dependent receptor n=1 Tax=uncultured Flavobacterium sp. TaxID=165435 RepID=UPI0030CA5B31
MKKFTKNLLVVLLTLTATTIFAQAKITGIVTDGDSNQPLSGASVLVKGTKVGSTTNFDGKFEITTTEKSGTLLVSFLGFETQSIAFNATTVDLGTIELNADASQLTEVVLVGRGIIDLASERKTPIAVSTIKADEIQAKIGTSDVTQLLVNTPSVYVAGQSGGYGDSRITVRGFQQDNTAFLLNGQPINGMEDGKMYWSNWSGMSDIANVIQIQRGLGSSKLAISSVGGTVNFVTKATDKKEGGFTSVGMANDSYFKTTAAYNTGIMENGFGASVLLSHWQGDGYNDGTKGEGQNYFISFGYKANERHSFNFLITGAPQYHDQNFTKSIATYLDKGRKYNNNWGTLDGSYLTERRNYYHKPVTNLNWDFQLTDKSSLSTVLYASWGRGGGTGNVGSRQRTADGLVDFDGIYATNLTQTGGKAKYAIRASANNHAWYGVVSNFKTALSEDWSFNTGIDVRSYKGTHFRQIVDLLGATYFGDNNNVNFPNNQITATYNANPWSALSNYASASERYSYDYSENINYGGLFSQLEYSKGDFSTFLQGAISNQTHKRNDVYAYLPGSQDAEKVSNFGYNFKWGYSYVISGNSSIYANAGYYSRQPYHDNIYLNFGNDVNPLTENEKILGQELGYNFKSNFISGSINAYRTSWKDRVTTTSNEVAGILQFTTNQGVEQVHSGLELDFVARPTKKLDIKGFASVGSWEYNGDVVKTVRDEDRNIISENREDVDGGKVGDAAQTTLGLGFKYKFTKHLSLDSDWRNYSDLYANVSPTKNNLKLPNYDLVDAGISYKMLIGQNKSKSVDFRLNINNVFDEVYLSELTSNNAAFVNGVETYKGINTNNNGFFGLGRTWSFSMKYNF